MSRIVALLHRDGRPADLESLRRLAAPLKNKDSDGPRFRVRGCAGLAYQCLRTSSGPDEQQPADLGPALSICFDGRLDNRDELIRDFRAELTDEPASLPDAFFAMACYRRFGDAFAAKLNGDFALALFDENKQQMLLARDVMGVRPLYYWLSEDTFIAASEIKAILAHPRVDPQPDNNALADLLIGGDPNEMRLTLFRDVRRVLPGHTVIVSPDAMRELRHWDFDPTRQIRCGSLSEYAEGLRCHFEQAVSRRLRSPGPVAVSVSGGLDSSAILCQAEILRQAGETIPAVHGISLVYPQGTPADEQHYLGEIESRYALRIRRLPASPIRASDESDWPRRLEYPVFPRGGSLDCLADAQHSFCATMLNGYFGDQILWSNARLYDLLRSFRWLGAHKALRALHRSHSDSTLGELRREILRGFVRDLVPDAFMRPFRSIRRLIGQDRSPGWYSRNLCDVAHRRAQQQCRAIGPFASKHAELCYAIAHASHVSRVMELTNKITAPYGLEMAYPFADRDLIAFVMAIPGEVINWDGTFKGLFREAMSGVLPERIRLRMTKADFTRVEAGAARTLASRRHAEIFGPGSLSVAAGYVDAGALSSSLSRLAARLGEQSQLPSSHMNTLFGLELWLRAYFADGLSDASESQ